MSRPLTEAEVGRYLPELQALGLGSADMLAGVLISPSRPMLASHLGISSEELQSIADAVAPLVSPHLANAGPTEVRATGARAPLAVHRSAMAMLPMVAGATLPQTVNLIVGMPPIRFQGDRGTCTSFATSAVHDYARGRGILSEQYLYFQCKQIDGYPQDCGTWLQTAAQVLANSGQCLDSTVAYNPQLPCNDPSAPGNAADQEAAGFRLGLTALNPHDVQALKTKVASGLPVAFSVPAYPSWWNPATDYSGDFSMPLNGEVSKDGHAMCMVGYEDDPSAPGGGRFILRNSWGMNWGSASRFGAGYGTIPYAYLASYGWEAVAT